MSPAGSGRLEPPLFGPYASGDFQMRFLEPKRLRIRSTARTNSGRRRSKHTCQGNTYNSEANSGDLMWRVMRLNSIIFGLSLLGCAMRTAAQTPVSIFPTSLVVADENSVPVEGAQVIFKEPEHDAITLRTDYAGRCEYVLHRNQPYAIRVEKPGFYETIVDQADPLVRDLHAVLKHEQMILQQVSVSASVPGINPDQISDKITMNLPEIINVPYQDSRDIRNLLPFYPGVVQEANGQIHVAGSETWSTLDTLDGFDIRSPVSGGLNLRVSADAVRSIDVESTRYPVEFGRSTGGVVAFYTGMGDNTFRFNATDFLPSFEEKNGIRFDKFVPRLTFSGPLVRDRTWFFDGVEAEYDDIYIQELPQGADINHLFRGSNLFKVQANVTPANIVSCGLLLNGYHSPYDGLSPLVPQQSTTERNTIAWLPYVRDQHTFHSGALLDTGLGVVRIRDGYDPHGNSAFEITPEYYQGSYFEDLSSHSQRIEGYATLYMPSRQWAGKHDLKAGIDLDHITFSETTKSAPIGYLREDRTLLRKSTFPTISDFTRHNFEAGAFLQDRWSPGSGLLIEPGLRFDWDEIIRAPLFSPRIAMTLSPAQFHGSTKLSAGIGLYYEHTQLEYLTRALASTRIDQYFAADGVTPAATPLESVFAADYAKLDEARAVNWSVGLEQRFPGFIFLKANFIQKRVSSGFTYVNLSGPDALSGIYELTNSRQDHDYVAEIDARRTFAGGHTLFAAYTHSSSRTNAAIDYMPTISLLGPQQSAPLPWDTPNRVLSWGWVPFLVPGFRKSWDFVYTLDWHTGFPFTSVNANYHVVGAAGGRRFPNYVSFSPGLEWRFHFRGSYFGLRGVIQNISDSRNPATVNNVVDSPQYGTFSEFEGRALTARIRLIGSKK